MGREAISQGLKEMNKKLEAINKQSTYKCMNTVLLNFMNASDNAYKVWLGTKF
jgi:hypothetical protein